jgi:hypothetical protein
MNKGKSIRKMFMMACFWIFFTYIPNLVLESINAYFYSYILTEIHNHFVGHIKKYHECIG